MNYKWLECRFALLLILTIVAEPFPLNADSAAQRYQYSPPQIVVPEGFSVDLVAAPPLLQHPMMGCFDDRGRLFIAEAAGLNLRSEELDEKLPNSILMLEDLDGDGFFDVSHIFADKMTNPNGVQWHAGALYVASPPHIWRLRDTNDDGFADQREPLVSGFKYSGIANSLHGPVLAPDGRLYWMQGIGGRGGNIQNQAGELVIPESWPGIFSCWPDGSDLRKHLNGGMDNPVEVAFTPEGQMLGTVNLIGSRPRNDAVVHWQWGGVYPRHDRMDAETRFPRTGDLLPTSIDFGHVAVSGLLRNRSSILGAEFGRNLFVTEFNTHRMRRVAIERQGATYRGEIHDFLHSPNTDTHFTDVIEDADGSLLVIDTGGWFRNGCPVSQVAKPNLKGAVYRIRKTGGETPNDPRGINIVWDQLSVEQLINHLDDERFAVRDRAIELLAQKGDAAVPSLSSVLTSGSSIQSRRNAVWALCRLRTSPAQSALRAALRDPDAGVREAAAHAVFANRDLQAVEQLITLLADEHPAIRRESAAALGILGDPQAVPGLLNALSGSPDRQLEHALIYALIEINNRDAALLGLKSPSPTVRRGALIALDQMPSGALTRDIVVPLLNTEDQQLQQSALAVITRHTDWGAEIVGLLQEWLNERQISPQRLSALRSAFSAFQTDPQIQELIAAKLADQTTAFQTRLMLLDVIGACELAQLPPAWETQLARSLEADTALETAQAVAAVTGLGTHLFDERLAKLAAEDHQPTPLRISAAAVVAGSAAPLPEKLFTLLTGQFREEVDPVDRLIAAGALADAKLNDDQRDRMLAIVAQAGPLEMPTLIRVFADPGNAKLGEQLIFALKQSPGLTSLTASQLSKLLDKYPASVQTAAHPLLQELNPDSASQAQRLAELSAVLDGGDAENGRSLFYGKRASCSACHRVAGEGGQIGPDLSTIGGARTKQDLLESIVFPSLSFAQGYESYHVLTKAGKVLTGVLARRTPDTVHLRTADRTELRVPHNDIEEIDVSGTSLMPQGLDRTLSPQELRDLLAYLQGLRAEKSLK